jgi:ribosomal protein S18 acetylase RimI-like enzyme
MKIAIRRIDSHGVELVAGLFDRYRAFYRQPSDIELARQYIQARLDRHESIIFLAMVEEEGKSIPAGFTQLYPNYSSIREAAYRGRHIGSALLRTALDLARGEHAQFIELMTATDNHVAQELYERVGFMRQEPENDFFTYRLFFDIQNQRT